MPPTTQLTKRLLPVSPLTLLSKTRLHTPLLPHSLRPFPLRTAPTHLALFSVCTSRRPRRGSLALSPSISPGRSSLHPSQSIAPSAMPPHPRELRGDTASKNDLLRGKRSLGMGCEVLHGGCCVWVRRGRDVEGAGRRV